MDRTIGTQENEEKGYLGSMQERGAELRDQLSEIDERARMFVRERPFAAVGIAVVAGFLLARIFVRR